MPIESHRKPNQRRSTELSKACPECQTIFYKAVSESLASWAEHVTCGKLECRKAQAMTRKKLHYERPAHPILDMFLRLSVSDYCNAIKLNRRAT